MKSPDGEIVFRLFDAPVGHAAELGSNDIHYSVEFRGKPLMGDSVLGLKLQGQPALGPLMRCVNGRDG